jgi:hypothetical protein
MLTTPDQLGENNQQAAEQTTPAASTTIEDVEGEIRAFVRRDALRRHRSDGEIAAAESSTRLRVVGDTNSDSLKSLIERVSAAPAGEIERTIAELASMRDLLRTEGERIQREIVGYATVSEAAVRSMTACADSLAQWKTQAQQIGPGRR